MYLALQTTQHPLLPPLAPDPRPLHNQQRHRPGHPKRELPTPLPTLRHTAASARREARHLRPLAPREEAQTRVLVEAEVEKWAEYAQEEEVEGEDDVESLGLWKK